MPLIEIKNRWTGSVIFSGEHDSVKACMAAALNMKASLRGADLRGADLRDADLRDADLRGADLRDAVLRDADLRGADLRDAVLRGAVLRDSKHAAIAIAMTRILPAGTLTVYKKAYSIESQEAVIVELEIPKDAKRSSAFGRKCRADRAVVISISDECKKARSDHDHEFTYEVGQTVVPKLPFSDEWTEECASGIHFFITREEAAAY